MREQIQKEAVEAALKNNCGTLAIPVRSGKTKIGLEIAKNFKKTLVSYPNKSIRNSWESDAKKFNYSLNNIDFTTHISFNKHDLISYDCIIIDEIDQFSENQWDEFIYIIGDNFNRLYGLTGTPPTKGIKKKFIDTYCPVIYSKKLDETVGILQKDYEIIVHLLNPSKEKNIPLKSGKTWSEESKINFWENKYNKSRNFMDMLKLIQSIQNSKTKLEYCWKLANKSKKCLIFLETKEQCNNLGFHSYYSGNKNSENNLELFQKNEITHLSCVKQLSAGITFNNLNEAILLHCYASNNKAHQRIARCLNYSEGEKATLHILCLKNTRDEQWVKKGLEEFNQNKITWKTIN